MAVALAAISLTWCLLASLLVGIGFLMPGGAQARAASSAGRDSVVDRLLVAFVLGFAGVIAFLQWWHLWHPIGAAALLIVAVAGAVGLGANVGVLRRAFLTVREHKAAAIVCLLLVIWTANRAMGPANAWDAGAYQFHAIRWANTYAVVPGLGNLDWHLGLNNAGLLFAAMLNASGTPWHGRASHVANGVLLTALFALAVSCAARVMGRAAPRPAAADVFGVVLVIPAVMLLMSKEVSSPRTDLAPAVVQFFAAWRFVSMFETSDPAARRRDWIFIVVTSVLSVCLKLSAVFVAAGLLFAATSAWLWRERPLTRRTVRAFAAATALSLSIAAPWVAQSVVLSGYPFFPSPILGQDVEWRVPAEVVKSAVDAVSAWPRVDLVEFAHSTSESVLPAWLHDALGTRDTQGIFTPRAWWLSLIVTGPVQIVAPACLTVVLGVAAWVMWMRGVWGPSILMAITLPGLAGVIGWRIVSPEPRFGYAAWWILAAAMAAIATARPLSLRLRIAVVAGCAIAAAPAVLHRAAVDYAVDGIEPFRDVPFYSAGPDAGLHPVPVTTYRSFTTASGLTLFEPADGLGLLWDGRLLAVPHQSAVGHIRLRDTAGDLSKGFAAR